MITITPDGRLTTTDAPIAEVERAIYGWREMRAAADHAEQVARLEAPVLALWETMTPLPDGRRADETGAAWWLERSVTGVRYRKRDGWAPGMRVVLFGGRVAHLARRGTWHDSCACGVDLDGQWSKPAPAGMPLCRAHREP